MKTGLLKHPVEQNVSLFAPLTSTALWQSLKSNRLINEPVNHFNGTTQGGAAGHLWEMSQSAHWCQTQEIKIKLEEQKSS